MIFSNPFSQNFRTPINVLAILQFEVVRIDSFKLIMMSVGWGEKWIGVGKLLSLNLNWCPTRKCPIPEPLCRDMWILFLNNVLTLVHIIGFF